MLSGADAAIKIEEPNVIIVGAGPVGLWTAIKLKKANPKLNILILERHESYVRTQRLRLEISLITDDAIRQELLAIVGGKVKSGIISIPVQDLEACLKKHALSSGVQIEIKEFVEKDPTPAQIDKAGLEAQYPNCDVVIGADGARSKTREAVFGKKEDVVSESPLQYCAQLNYTVAGKVSKLADPMRYEKQLGGWLCYEDVKYDEVTNTSSVSLRFFIDKTTFSQIEGAKLSKPMKYPDDRGNVPDELHKAIVTWVQARNDPSRSSMKLTAITLSEYSLKFYSKQEGKKNWFAVGDAAFAVPFYRALNGGIKCATQLASVVSANLARPSPDESFKLINAAEVIKKYNKAADAIFMKESFVAKLKSLGLNTKKRLLTVAEKISSSEPSSKFSRRSEAAVAVRRRGSADKENEASPVSSHDTAAVTEKTTLKLARAFQIKSGSPRQVLTNGMGTGGLENTSDTVSNAKPLTPDADQRRISPDVDENIAAHEAPILRK